jgi:hypothetical protein
LSGVRALTAGLAALLAAALLCPLAVGDADPASDVLLGENVFYPYSPQVSARLQATLNAQVAAAHRGHLPIKVALIATPVDLGALPTFFGKPRQYAAFLDQEISFGGKVPLLVVMLAQAAGHPVAAAPSGSAGSGGSAAVPLAVLAGVCVALAALIISVRRRRARPR